MSCSNKCIVLKSSEAKLMLLHSDLTRAVPESRVHIHFGAGSCPKKIIQNRVRKAIFWPPACISAPSPLCFIERPLEFKNTNKILKFRPWWYMAKASRIPLNGQTKKRGLIADQVKIPKRNRRRINSRKEN